MRKCSLPTHRALSELNITPLLDLAFVLLVIFIITTAPVVNDLDVRLPSTSDHPKDPPQKANFITLAADGTVRLNNQTRRLEDLQGVLAAMRVADPDLNVIVRPTPKRPTSKFAPCWMPADWPIL